MLCSVLSTLGKCLSRVINDRLSEWAERYYILIEAQAGFRPGMSTVDNSFFLHGLITHYLNRGKKLFCAFVYFTKAFNYVMHDNLWFRLVKLGLRGNTLKIVKSMYEIVKSRVKFCEKNWKRILLFTWCKARRMFISCFVFYVRFFSKFCRRHSELVENYNVSLRKLLQQGISEPESYGDLVYRISNIVGKSNFRNNSKILLTVIKE